ncbi:MAG: hypothetical protein ACU0CA_07870 [Paracoccaceae bacterium]
MKFSRAFSKANLSLFVKREDGAGIVMGLFLFLTIAVIGGIALDSTNLWRNQQVLQQTADISSHAGAVAIANGADEGEIRNIAVDAIQFNMATSRWGKVLEDATTDVTLLNYDPVTNTVSTAGKINAVRVTLQRSKAVNNPVKTLLLKMVSFASGNVSDLSSFDVRLSSVTALAATQECNSSDIIYAKDDMQITSSNTFGRGYCVHSQSTVWMPQQNTFLEDTGISMPNLANCGSKCTDSSNPGATDAAFQSNMLIEDLADLIDDTITAFESIAFEASLRSEFFASKSLDPDLQALIDAGIKINGLIKGSVVSISQNTFESLDRIPEGLIYSINCNSNGNGGNSWLTIGSKNVDDAIRNVAIITSCGLDFDSTANITGSLLVSTRTANTATVRASSGASIGTNTATCSNSEKSYIMAKGDLNVPADFAGSNVAFIIDGDVHLSASSSSSTINHVGASILSTGEVHVSANHTFDSCTSAPSGLMPKLLVIRHVVPT